MPNQALKKQTARKSLSIRNIIQAISFLKFYGAIWVWKDRHWQQTLILSIWLRSIRLNLPFHSRISLLILQQMVSRLPLRSVQAEEAGEAAVVVEAAVGEAAVVEAQAARSTRKFLPNRNLSFLAYLS